MPSTPHTAATRARPAARQIRPTFVICLIVTGSFAFMNYPLSFTTNFGLSPEERQRSLYENGFQTAPYMGMKVTPDKELKVNKWIFM